MGEVFCVTQGDVQKLTQWVNAKPDRYVVWVGESQADHPRILKTNESELSLQQIVAQLLYLPFVYEDSTHPALQRLARIQTEIHFRASDYLDQGVKLLTNFRSNLEHSTCLASDCFGRFDNVPAIVCGAGPSLKNVIPFLKENQDRFLIIGCGAGLQALVSAGIQPHLTVQVDPDPYHKFPKNSAALFYQLRTSHEVVKQMQGPRFLMAGSGEFSLERWLEQKLGLESPTDGGWTATTRGVSLAAALGCRSIYFAGVDFSATSTPYAKGVQAPQEGSLMKMKLPDGKEVQTRSDWLLSAEWINEWVTSNPEIECGLLSESNPLMPALPPIKEPQGAEGVTFFAQEVFARAAEKEGKQFWHEIAESFKTCKTLVNDFLAHFQKIFPNVPSADATCMKILQELDRQDAVQLVIDPIWSHWEVVLKRAPDSHPEALIVHRILLIKTLADKFYA